MRFPQMQRQARTTVTVPQLNGGLNLHDQPEHVNDNQLTACDNVWWHNGALQTRPGLQKIAALNGFGGTVWRQILNERETLLMRWKGYGAGGYIFYAVLVSAVEGVRYIGNESNAYRLNSDHGVPTTIGVKAPKNAGYEWLFFADVGLTFTYSRQDGWKTADQPWDPSRSFTTYTPHVWFNGRGNDAPGGSDAVTLEAPNLLNDCVRCTFTTDGVSAAYTLPLIGTPTYARLTMYDKNDDGTITTTVHETDFDSSYNLGLFRDLKISDAQAVNIQVLGDQIIFFSNPGGKSITLPEALAESANNLEITLRCDFKDFEDGTIAKMTRTIWFGGDRSGADNGIHLFVAGNPEKPNLLRWSDINNPLYFPENNYVYVGEDDGPITALAKQGELLVIFREHDIYCVQYVAGSVPTTEEMVTGVSAEITVHKAYFPLTQLHPSIGCDCPDTVRLVNNKLVWLTSDGRVHILTGSNQYSERNVRQASPLIEPALRQHAAEELRTAVAGEYEGYYVLIVGNKAYVLDCQTSAFNSFQYYSREETAQKSLPWYTWSLPEHSYAGVVYDGNGMYIAANDLGAGALFALSGRDDDGTPIRSTFTTKHFDFARSDAKKSIDQLYIDVADVEGCHLDIGYVTDRYTLPDAFRLVCDGAASGAMRTFRITPNVRMVQRFALQVTACDSMTLSGLAIKYKNQGVVR